MIKLLLELDAPEVKKPDQYENHDPLARIRECAELVDSGYESAREWNIIRTFWNRLMKKKKEGKKLTKKERQVLDLVRPAIEKYGMDDERGIE